MCTLAGFRIRCGGCFVLLASESYIRQVFDKKAEIIAENFHKISVVDLFDHGKPKQLVDLELVEQAEDLVDTLIETKSKKTTFWENASLVCTAQSARHFEETKQMQKRLAEKKRKRLAELAAKRKKVQEKRVREMEEHLKKAQQQRNEREKKRQHRQQQKRNLRRKRTRELKIKVAKAEQAQAKKIQRVALDTLSAKHLAHVDDLQKKHRAETKALRDKIDKLEKKIEDTNRRAEHQKLQCVIDSLKNEIKFLRSAPGKSVNPAKDDNDPAKSVKAPPPNSVNTVKLKPPNVVTNSVALARAIERVNSVGSSSSSSSGGGLTPIDPNCGTPYDPLMPIPAPPVRRTPASLRMSQMGGGGGYDYYTRRVMSRTLPTRRELAYGTPPQYGGFDFY